jgi:hypothetical protein
MPSMSDFGDPEEIAQHAVRVRSPSGKHSWAVAVDFYVNRIGTSPPEPSPNGTSSLTERNAARQAEEFCFYVAGWDITGPVVKPDGTVLVAAGEPVPLEPPIIRHVYPWLRLQILTELVQVVFPNANALLALSRA